MKENFYKSQNDKKISGVCAGIAESLNIDVTVVRVFALVLCFCAPFMTVIYFLLACSLPEKHTGIHNCQYQDDVYKIKNVYNTDQDSKYKSKVFRVGCYCLFAGALLSLLLTFILGETISFIGIIRYSLLAIGLCVLISAMKENLTPNAKHTRIIVGVSLIIMDILSIFKISGISQINTSGLTFALIYTWPLILTGIILTILFANKRIIKYMWLVIIAFVIINALN